MCGSAIKRTFAPEFEKDMNRIFVLGLMALASVSTCYADAENILDESAVADTSKVVDLDEVVVVAQPKEGFLLRQQPLSSSVFGAKELQQMNVQSLGQLSYYVPSFTMPEYGSRLTSSMYIRGIGSRINNSAVGIYYDHIPLMSKSAFNTHFYMLDRVDVLRGAQGTLYGANTEGGIVRIYSKNPMSYQGTDVNIGVGTHFTRKAEVAHYQRLGDELAFMVAAFYNGQDGFFKNSNLNEYNDKMNEAGAKVRLMWKPQTRLTLDLTSDYQYTNQNGFPYGLYDVENDETADPSTTFMNDYRRQMVNTGLTVSYDFDNYLLTSTTSHQYLWDRMNMDQDYVAADYMSLQQVQKMNAVTEEVVLRTNNASRWQHTSGLFGSYQWLRTDAPVGFGDAITGPIGKAIENAMKNAMVQAMMGRFLGQGMTAEQAKAMAQQTVDKMGVTMSAEMAVPGTYRTPALSLAAFHESNILLSDNLKLTLGLRYNIDKVKIDYDALAYMNMTGGTSNAVATYHLTSHVADSRHHTYTQLLPKVGLTYSFNENLGNVYALVSKGYRAGGYNVQMFSDILRTDLNNHQQDAMKGDYDVTHSDQDYDNIVETIAYKPEESWNYEAGFHLNLFNNKVKADASFFFTQLQDQQLSVMIPNSGYGRMTVNAGKSHSCGVELALRGQAFDDRLSWGATYSFTRAVFEDYTDSLKTATGYEEVSYKDKYVPFIPMHQFSANADYRFDVRNAFLKSVVLGVNAKGQGKTYWEADNELCQKFYATLGAHLALDMNRVVVDFWGRNLTNTNYNTFLVNSQLTNQNFAQRGLPLQVGVDVKMHF